MSQDTSPMKHNENEALVASALETLIAFLTGERLDAQIDEPVNILREQAPDILLKLNRRLLGEDEQADLICSEASEDLDEYLALGDEAAARMPIVDRHLNSCERFREELKSLRAVMKEQNEALLKFSQSLNKKKPLTRAAALALTRKAGWQLRGGDRALDRELTEQDLIAGLAVGNWRLSQTPASAQSFSLYEGVKPVLSLSHSMPDNVARIQLRVTHEHIAMEHKYVWQLTFKLDPNSMLKSLIVGVGNEQTATKGKTTLSGNRQWILQVEPPTKISYWVHFWWTSDTAANRAWRQHKAELPLCYDDLSEEV